jgi:crotonobetainyl-CoA:carnitine CoA-transferase CaiB-like acyl-CoA transferase
VSAPLDGYRVIDLAGGTAGGYCTKLLADGGADVILVEPPGGDALRRWTASDASVLPGDDGALFQFLGCSKRSVVVDPASAADIAFLRRLVECADAVVWADTSPFASVGELSPGRLRETAPRTTVVALTAFGLSGPWAGRAATELTLQAWAGAIGARGAPELPPVSMGGRGGQGVPHGRDRATVARLQRARGTR